MKPILNTIIAVTFLMLLNGLACNFISYTTTTSIEKLYQIDDYSVSEKIFEKFGLPDKSYVRQYQFKYDCSKFLGCKNFDLGTYEDEGKMGINIPPQIMDNKLVVFSTARVFVYDLSKMTVVEFDPYDANGFIEYSKKTHPNINGYYNCSIEHVTLNGEIWTFVYKVNTRDTEYIRFESRDGGKTFTLLKE